MTAKRFKEERGIAKFIDNQTGKEYSEYNLDEIVCLLNELHEENQSLKLEIEKVVGANECLLTQKRRWEECSDNYAKLYEENEQLKTTIQQLTNDNTKQKKKLNTTMKKNEHLKQQLELYQELYPSGKWICDLNSDELQKELEE